MFDLNTYRTGTARIDIQNGINFYVHVYFQGFLSHAPTVHHLFGNNQRKGFSYATICSKPKHPQNKFVLYETGQRENDDVLVRFQRKIVNGTNSRQHFEDPFIKITKLQLIANVSLVN